MASNISSIRFSDYFSVLILPRAEYSFWDDYYLKELHSYNKHIRKTKIVTVNNFRNTRKQQGPGDVQGPGNNQMERL